MEGRFWLNVTARPRSPFIRGEMAWTSGLLNHDQLSFNEHMGRKRKNLKFFCQNRRCMNVRAHLYVVPGLSGMAVAVEVKDKNLCGDCGGAAFASRGYGEGLSRMDLRLREHARRLAFELEGTLAKTQIAPSEITLHEAAPPEPEPEKPVKYYRSPDTFWRDKLTACEYLLTRKDQYPKLIKQLREYLPIYKTMAAEEEERVNNG